jgi:hypothetical protein
VRVVVGIVLVNLGIAIYLVIKVYMMSLPGHNARVGMIRIQVALEEYAHNNGDEYPEALDELLQRREGMDRMQRSITGVQELSDPWGRPYVYSRIGPGKYTLCSLGRDGVPGGEEEDEDLIASETDYRRIAK